MMVEKVPDSTYEMIGGLDKQIKEIKEVICFVNYESDFIFINNYTYFPGLDATDQTAGPVLISLLLTMKKFLVHLLLN